MQTPDSITLHAPLKWVLGIAATLVSTGIVALVGLVLALSTKVEVMAAQMVVISDTTKIVNTHTTEIAVLKTEIQELKR